MDGHRRGILYTCAMVLLKRASSSVAHYDPRNAQDNSCHFTWYNSGKLFGYFTSQCDFYKRFKVKKIEKFQNDQCISRGSFQPNKLTIFWTDLPEVVWSRGYQLNRSRRSKSQEKSLFKLRHCITKSLHKGKMCIKFNNISILNRYQTSMRVFWHIITRWLLTALPLQGKKWIMSFSAISYII